MLYWTSPIRFLQSSPNPILTLLQPLLTNSSPPSHDLSAAGGGGFSTPDGRFLLHGKELQAPHGRSSQANPLARRPFCELINARWRPLSYSGRRDALADRDSGDKAFQKDLAVLPRQSAARGAGHDGHR